MTLNTSERCKLAHRIAELRTAEKIGGYQKDRNRFQYYYFLKGLDATLDYVRGLDSKTVLDIGAGTTRAASELARKNPDLFIFATALNYHPDFDRNLGERRIRLTPAERLRGFKSKSVSLMICVYSICYCAYPVEAVMRMDEVLEPGGVIKGNLLNKTGLDTLCELGYDIEEEDEVFLAVKPPFEKGLAKKLFLQDKLKNMKQRKQNLQNFLERFIAK